MNTRQRVASDPSEWALRDLADAFSTRALSPVEVVESFLRRISSLDPLLHAYAQVWSEAALAQARASEQRLLQGAPRGLLEGVPLAVKDLLHVQGRRTGAGSALFADRPCMDHSATVATRLQDAGAILLGKTHLVELAYGGWGTNQGMGTPRNPWDMAVHRAPGGSSSGSAVAVASGLAAGAIGTDTGGSVRIPSAFCGLTGLKTTAGRVSRYGVDLLSETLDTVGPMTRTAEDAACLLQAMHGPDPRDPTTLGTAAEDFLQTLGASVVGVRFALLHQTLGEGTSPAVRQGVEDACKVLRALGCVEAGGALPQFDLAADQEASGAIISAEAYARHGEALHRSTTSGDAASRARILRGAHIAPSHYREALDQRRSRMAEFQRLFKQLDVLVLPTVQVTAADLATLDESDPAPSRMTRFVGYYGLCAIALPCGFSAEGLPVSLQLVAAPWREDLLLRLGAAFQRETTHHCARPLLDAFTTHARSPGGVERGAKRT
ncbi:amidase [Variovorax sp. H27-G14]|uniref:amidase n=1 Tax=Variovorax sp. H27-G14 TaxID=3111914 RepID=UPI0038FC73A9